MAQATAMIEVFIVDNMRFTERSDAVANAQRLAELQDRAVWISRALVPADAFEPNGIVHPKPHRDWE